MQLVGRSCEECDRKVRADVDGVGCPRCDIVYHTQCLAQSAGDYRSVRDTERCPRCEVGFTEQLEEERQVAQKRVSETFERGRMLFVGVVMGAIAAAIVSTVLEWHFHAGGIVSAVVLGMLLLYTYLGSSWARPMLQLQLIVLILLSAFDGVGDLIGHETPLKIRGILAVLWTAILALVSFAPDIRALLDHQRHRAERAGRERSDKR